ncbi:MAG TPA: GTPase, partial [Acidimicrobiales bacterium]|nr:GTPase [Acidimicrobiales bacterium]
KLEGELSELEATRRTQRRQRRRGAHRSVSLVGYTNSGKSTLLNALTDADVLVENRLFATLDPRTRRLQLPGGETILCSDTVGFVRKLPHELVDAFHSTLEVAVDSDLLVHVADCVAPDPEGQIEAVRDVLAGIGAGDVPELLACNKADLDHERAESLAAAHDGAVVLSALGGEGIGQLLEAIGEALRTSDRTVELSVPYDRGDVLAALHRSGEVLETRDEGGSIVVRARLDEASRRRFSEFLPARPPAVAATRRAGDRHSAGDGVP